MRRDQKDLHNKGRVKLRVIDFEIDASDATLQDTLSNIVTAIGRGTGFHRVHDQKQLPQASEHSTAETESTFKQHEQADETEPKRGKSIRDRKSWSARSPKVLDDLKINEAKDPLKDYIERKRPDGNNERYLAIAGWLKENFGLREITMDHVHTCYRHLGWQTPKDASAPLRAMTNQNEWFTKAKTKGAYALNHVGENIIMKMGEEG
jgi:hypothetical protein